MTTKRIIKLFQSFLFTDNNLFFVYGETNDLFCDKKLRLSNFNYQLFEFLNSYQRKAFINAEQVYFLDNHSYNGFMNYDLENKSSKPINGPLGELKLINFKFEQKVINNLFKTEFLKNLNYFIKQNIKSLYVINSENNSDIFDIVEILKNNNNKNNHFIITIKDMTLLEKIIRVCNLTNSYIYELENPFDDEIYNLLNLLRIKNNISFDLNKEFINQKKFGNLSDLYNKLKGYQDIDITDIINQICKMELTKDKTDWLEL